MVMTPMVMTGGRRLANGHDKLPMVMTNRLRRGLPMVMTLMVMTEHGELANGHDVMRVMTINGHDEDTMLHPHRSNSWEG